MALFSWLGAVALALALNRVVAAHPLAWEGCASGDSAERCWSAQAEVEPSDEQEGGLTSHVWLLQKIRHHSGSDETNRAAGAGIATDVAVANEQNDARAQDTANMTLSASGFCKDHGCGAYKKGQACQCVSSCSKYKNCCADFYTTCKKTSPQGAPDCQDAPTGKCATAINWARSTGLKQHPDWYGGLKPGATAADVQKFLNDKGSDGCPKPCSSGKTSGPAVHAVGPKCQDVKSNDGSKCAEKVQAQMSSDERSGKTVAPLAHYQREIWWSQTGVGDCPAPCTTPADEGGAQATHEGVSPERGVSPGKAENTVPAGEDMPEKEPAQEGNCRDVEPNDGSECADQVLEQMASDKWSGHEILPFAHYQRAVNQQGLGGCPAPCTSRAEDGNEEDATTPDKPDCPSVPDSCRAAIEWTMSTGLPNHPTIYEGLKPGASEADIQRYFNNLGEEGCPAPCSTD